MKLEAPIRRAALGSATARSQSSNKIPAKLQQAIAMRRLARFLHYHSIGIKHQPRSPRGIIHFDLIAS